MTSVPTRAHTQQSSVLPRDEATRDPEFFLFRARLQRAVAAHDTAAVMATVSLRILNSFGGNGGRQEFRESWGLAQPEKSERSTVDGFEGLIVLGQNVMVRAEPDAGSAAIDTVSFEAVTKWREQPSTDGWQPVRTSKQRTGWIREVYLRSPIDHRAGFVRQEGHWWLRALVAGD